MKDREDEIMVSVLMFVYNHEKYLRKALESVIRQETDFRYEIIVHDDASTDGSAEIIKAYARKYPDLFVPILQEENQMQQGISIVDEYLMPRVKGKYIAHCEGDDFWTKREKLQVQVEFLEEHEEYAGIAHNCQVVDERGRQRKPVEKFWPFKNPYIYTLKDLILEERMPGQTASVLYRRKYQTQMGDAQKDAYRKIRCCVGDRRRTLLILLNGPVYCMNRTMSAYRYVPDHGQSWNARVRGKNLAGRYFIQEKDFRCFARTYYKVRLSNDYVLFGTGIMALLRFLINPVESNQKELKLILNEYKSPLHFGIFMIRCFPKALQTLIARTIRKVKGI